jgi:hypothetical protein
LGDFLRGVEHQQITFHGRKFKLPNAFFEFGKPSGAGIMLTGWHESSQNPAETAFRHLFSPPTV